MSETKRWWSLSRMLTSLQIWRENRNFLSSATAKIISNRSQSAESSSNDSKKSEISEYEDMEEFVERQREARLTGYVSDEIITCEDNTSGSSSSSSDRLNSSSNSSGNGNGNDMYTASSSASGDNDGKDIVSAVEKIIKSESDNEITVDCHHYRDRNTDDGVTGSESVKSITTAIPEVPEAEPEILDRRIVVNYRGKKQCGDNKEVISEAVSKDEPNHHLVVPLIPDHLRIIDDERIGNRDISSVVVEISNCSPADDASNLIDKLTDTLTIYQPDVASDLTVTNENDEFHSLAGIKDQQQQQQRALPVNKAGSAAPFHESHINVSLEARLIPVVASPSSSSSSCCASSEENRIKDKRHVSQVTITLQSVPDDDDECDNNNVVIISKNENNTPDTSDSFSSPPAIDIANRKTVVNSKNALLPEDKSDDISFESKSESRIINPKDMEYRDHFEEMKSTFGRNKLRNSRKYAMKRLSATIRIDKAWKSLRDWWTEEKHRLSLVVGNSGGSNSRKTTGGGDYHREEVDNKIDNQQLSTIERNYRRAKSEDAVSNNTRYSVTDECDRNKPSKTVTDAAEVSTCSSFRTEDDTTIDDDEALEDGTDLITGYGQRQSSIGRLSTASLSDYHLRRRHRTTPSSTCGGSSSRPQSCFSDISDINVNRFPRRNPPHPPPSRTSGISAFRRSRCIHHQGQEGFEELRRYIKQGGDFCKELSVILQERSEAEIQYAKTLSKLSAKLLKSSKDSSIGTVTQAWHKAVLEMESIAEIHRTFATALSEEVVKPLKQLLESQHRIRKSVETAVDKTSKSLSEWRAAECKSKKQSFVSARENEKLQDMMLDIRLNGTTALATTNKLTASTLHLHHQRPSTEKESTKLESKRRKAEEMVKKSDVEYYTYCIRAERARLEWETAVMRGSHCFQALEEERLEQLKHLCYSYWQHCQDIGPKLMQSSLRLKEPLETCDVNADIKTISTLKGKEQPVSEQLLPDFYAEHMTLAMNRERRRQALVKILQLIVHDLEREKRGKNGVENLARAFKQTPTFGTDDSQQNVSEKLHHMKYMLTYLEAARYKVSNALAEVDVKPKTSHPLSSHIHVIRDKQGLQQSVLKVPAWISNDIVDTTSVKSEPLDWNDRGTADGNSVQPDSDFDEFSSQSSNSEKEDFETNAALSVTSDSSSGTTALITKQCKALYHYSANLYDELNLQPGDIINIHDKQPDGWWLGELNGVIGIFPATYVQEIG